MEENNYLYVTFIGNEFGSFEQQIGNGFNELTQLPYPSDLIDDVKFGDKDPVFSDLEKYDFHGQHDELITASTHHYHDHTFDEYEPKVFTNVATNPAAINSLHYQTTTLDSTAATLNTVTALSSVSQGMSPLSIGGQSMSIQTLKEHDENNNHHHHHHHHHYTYSELDTRDDLVSGETSFINDCSYDLLSDTTMPTTLPSISGLDTVAAMSAPLLVATTGGNGNNNGTSGEYADCLGIGNTGCVTSMAPPSLPPVASTSCGDILGDYQPAENHDKPCKQRKKKKEQIDYVLLDANAIDEKIEFIKYVGKGSYKCQICNIYSKNNKDYIQDHINIKHYNIKKNYECLLCPTKFAWRSGAFKHLKKYHFIEGKNTIHYFRPISKRHAYHSQRKRK